MNELFLLEMSRRISWTLVHSIWQFGIISIVLAVGLFAMRGRFPHLRYGLMLTTMGAMAIMPMVTFFLVETPPTSSGSVVLSVCNGESSENSQLLMCPTQSPQNTILTEEKCSTTTELESPENNANLFSSVATLVSRLALKWMNVILSVWIPGMLLLSFRPLVSWRATRQLRFSGRTSLPSDIVIITSRVAERLGLHTAIEVAQSSLVEVPTVIGWLKPLLLLPASSVCGLTSEQLEAIIAHELAHIRRHDYLVNIFQLMMETVFFFHPAVWWISHIMRVTREECCDDIAVHMTGDRLGYAKLLLLLEESRSNFSLSNLGMAAGGGSLSSRISRIVSPPAQTARMSTLTVAVVLTFIGGLGCFVVFNTHNSFAQDSVKLEAAPQSNQQPEDETAEPKPLEAVAVRNWAVMYRNWMIRAIELKEWERLAQLAPKLAHQGEFDEALKLLSKAPLGKAKEGKLTPKYYYRAVSEICEIALLRGKLYFVKNVYDQLTDPEKQTPASVKYPPQVGDIQLAILKHHIYHGQINEAIDYLESHPSGRHAGMVRRVAALDNNHHVESFLQRLTGPKLRSVLEHHLANMYFHRSQPDKIWRLADQIAKDRPEDLIAEVRIRNTAMNCYAKFAPVRFDELLPAYRDKLNLLPSDQQSRFWKNLALSAAKMQRYEIVVELSSKVPLLPQSQGMFMDLSGTDFHPVLYAITELQKQNKYAQALVLIDSVEDEAVVLAAFARLANRIQGNHEIDEHAEFYQQIVTRLALAYKMYSARNEEATVRDVSRGLPEMLHFHLQRINEPQLLPNGVTYLDRESDLFLTQITKYWLEQGKYSLVVQQAETMLEDGKPEDLGTVKWMARELARTGEAEAFERLRPKIKAALSKSESKKSEHLWDYRRFLAFSAHAAYLNGHRDLCFEIFMKLDRNWINPSTVSRVANSARTNGDIQFLKRMKASSSPLMREAALEALSLHHVLEGDIESAKQAAEIYVDEYGLKNHASIYWRITHRNSVKDPQRRLVATQMALNNVPVDSKDYTIIARDHAKLLGLLFPDKPLPEAWLKKLNDNPSLRLSVEIEHALGVYDRRIAC